MAAVRLLFRVAGVAGFVRAEVPGFEAAPLGLVVFARVYSPVRKVSYSVVRTVAGVVLAYGFLVMGFVPGGGVSVEDAFVFVVRVVRVQVFVFVRFDVLGGVVDAEGVQDLALRRSLFGAVGAL
ncbi:hypothetical protein [Ahrensia kielensis]|uniref:hypothetical protein n=1 Tax=Ahrensia kielensis TaxID=76980 RepID=UPI0012EA572F|nr:hypothetical protein [Ahrensia kielensis]